mmetsp:Transcript_31596/g.87162  ORF Transcript_31596/g.87162 Transcript_31596/m.87162 type:complete len:373 (+) Transcript_31596:97-1215(+)
MTAIVLRRLIGWWLRRFHEDAVRGLRAWRQEPEWPLLVVGITFFVSFLLHWVGYRLALHQVTWPTMAGGAPIFQPTEWEGRVGWRKPLVFGISNAMIFVSLRQALRAQQHVPRAAAAHTAAWSTAVEVGVITLQAWRGVPSHFNTATALDAALYGVKLVGALLLSATCVAATIGVHVANHREPCGGAGRSHSRPRSAAQALALCQGLNLMCVAAAVGVAQVVYGHFPREARVEETARCLEVTAGALGSPCYEIHGEAVVKLAHFLPLHATEVLLLLAWAVDRSPLGKRGAMRLMRAATAGCWGLALLGLQQTACGEDLKRPSFSAAVILASSLASICVPFALAFFSPACCRCTKDQDAMAFPAWTTDRVASG